jgi:hypothetical protein
MGASALANFLACLPPGVTRWVVAYRPAWHAELVRRLTDALPVADLLALGVDSPAAIRSRAVSELHDTACGLLDLISASGDRATVPRRQR